MGTTWSRGASMDAIREKLLILLFDWEILHHNFKYRYEYQNFSGFNDTEGLEQDACNLACVHDMLKQHKPLQSLSGKSDAKVN